MNIKTSYFGNLKNIHNGISIALYPPDWYKGFRYYKLAPPKNLFDRIKGISHPDIDLIEDYLSDYKKEVLGKLDPNTVYLELSHYHRCDDFTLLCFEKDDTYCHRKVVAEWLTENGYPCEEFNGTQENK